jgi:integrase
MRRHQGHIRQRAEGSFEIRYNLGTDPLTGKRKVKTVTVKGDRKAAEKELRHILNTISTNEYIEPTRITIGDFLKQWLETVRTQISPKTYESYEKTVRNYLTPTFGAQQLCKLAPMAIQQAYNGWEREGRKDGKLGGLSPRSRLYIHRVLKQALKYAIQLQILGRNPADAVKPPRQKKIAITTLTIEQSTTLLDAIRGALLYWPVLLALTTGMRRGEILALRWKNVDFEKKAVRVVEALEQTGTTVRFKAPKTEKGRAILLPEYAVEELKGLKEKQAEKLAERGIQQTGETTVCARFDGTPMWPSSLTHEFKKALDKLPDLPHVRFHDLRHSHATHLMMEGVHPKIVQERLGHSTITITLDLYTHATDTMQEEAAAKLDTAFRSAIKHKLNRGPQPT